MLALLTASLSLTGGPTGALDMWRTSRLTQWSRVVDRRFDEEYHAFGKERTSGTVLGSDWGAEGRSDWEQWSSHPSGEGTDASVLCLTDFLASGLPPASAAKLPTQMQQLIAPPEQLGDTAVLVELIDRSIVDLPQLDAADEPVRAAVDDVVGAAAVCCAQLVAYLEALMREHATRAFERDLVTSCASAARAAGGYARDVTWEEAQAGMQREHDVDGGLSDEERRGLYDVYIEGLRSQSGGSVRVDVSDLGLTMDDLSGPFL